MSDQPTAGDLLSNPHVIDGTNGSTARTCQGDMTMIAVKEPEFDTRLLTGIRVALRKARELGYPVERMDVTASVSDVCSVHFAPMATAGTIIAGGDLSVAVDPETEEVTGITRGQ